MKAITKIISVVVLMFFCVSLFQACMGNDGLCYVNMDFVITENEECTDGTSVGFELLFKDKFGTEYLKSYTIPSTLQSQVIALPPDRSYDVYMRNNGVQNGCVGPVYFDIVITDPDDKVECLRLPVSADERPGFFLDPIVSFDLGETCDSCPEFRLEN